MIATRVQRSFVGRRRAAMTSITSNSSSSWSSTSRTHDAVASQERRSFATTHNKSSSSVSSEEVSKFSKMAQHDNNTNYWWDPEQHPLVTMNPVRMKFIKDTLQGAGKITTTSSSPLQSLTMLDCGCGGGLLSESLARLGAARVVAIDPSVELVEAAKQHAHKHDPLLYNKIDYRGGTTIEELAAQSDSTNLFDVICCLEVIEHVKNVDSLLQAASLLLKPDGVLFISTINRTWKSHLLAIVGAEYIMGYIPKNTHDWNLFRSPEEVKELCSKAKLQQVRLSGMTLSMPPPFFDGKWRWRLDPNDLDVNWIGAYKKEKMNRTNHE